MIAGEYGPLAASQRDDLKRHLARTLEQIDGRPLLARAVEIDADHLPDAQPAFEIWRSAGFMIVVLLAGLAEIGRAAGALVVVTFTAVVVFFFVLCFFFAT